MHIAQSKTREQFPLSYKKIMKKTLASTIVITFTIIIAWILAFTLNDSTSSSQKEIVSLVTYGVFGILFLIIVLNYLYQRWYFAVYYYDLTTDYVQIKKGPITPSEITIPYERIQDVYVDQDLLDRIFGLYDVHLSSATVSSGIEAHIDGVEKTAADGLRAVLLDQLKQRISTTPKVQ